MLGRSGPDPKLAAPALNAGASVVLVAYMTGESLFPSIESALSQADVGEVVIVDNGSTSGDAERLAGLAAKNPRVQLVSGQGNVGFASGANLGAHAARGELLVFLNPDAFLGPGGVAALAQPGRRPDPESRRLRTEGRATG